MPRLAKRLPLETADRTLRVIGGRWKTHILWAVCDGPKRLSELQRSIPEASQKVIIQQLREMERHGLLSREVFRQVPPRVDYTATALGMSLRPVIKALCEWGRRHRELATANDPPLVTSPGEPALRRHGSDP